MKLTKKALLLTSMIPLLASCSTSSIAGTYYFQMGKEQGTHFGVYLYLTDEAYIPEEGEDIGNESFKKFTFDASFQFPTEEEGSASEAIESILKYFPNGIPGYYRLTDEKNPKGEQRIKVGINYHDVYDTFKQIYKDTAGEDFPVEEEELETLNNSAVIQSLLYTTYKDSTVNMYIPVSFDDVYYQLYWYGKDVKINIEQFEINIVDVTPHDLGTHPKAEEIEAINKTFETEHQGCMITTFRDFNQVKMGLIKK